MAKDVKVRRGRRLSGREWTIDRLNTLRTELGRVFDRFTGSSSRSRHAVGEEITGEPIASLDVPDSVHVARITAKLAGGMLTVTLPDTPEAVGASREIAVEGA